MNFKKLGLALAGGGGKGAYQIGVWRALRDFQLDTQISAISGSSVGGLNGALMVQGKFDKAESMWLNIESHNMLTLQDVDVIGPRLAAMGASGAISPLLMGLIKTKGLFKRDGLQNMINEGLDADLLVNSAIPLTVSLHHMADNRVHYQTISEAHIANNALLATAALPLIFDEVQLDGTSYSDGGFYWWLPHKNVENIPLKPLIETGCDTIIVVCLSQDDLDIAPHMFPGVRVLPIVPTRVSGGITATLDFSNKGAALRMEQGYADAVFLLQHLDLYLKNEDQYQSLWQRALAGAEVEKKIQIQLGQVDKNHSKTVSDIGDFDRTIAGDDFTQPLDLADDDDAVPGAIATLALDNAALLADLERQTIQTDVDRFVTLNQNNRQVVEATVLDAMAALSPVTGRADHLREQGILARVWGAITGKNQKLAADNDHALAQAQFASLRLIAAVQQKGAITLEFTVALQNRLNGAFKEIERLGNRQNQDLRRVYQSLAGVYTKLRNQLINHETRLSKVERRVDLIHWLAHPNATRYHQKSLKELPVSMRLAYLANDFFGFTLGDWKVEELVSLKEMCINVGLPDTSPVKVADFCTAVLTQPDTAQALTHNLTIGTTKSTLHIPAAKWLQDLRNNSLPEDKSTENALQAWHYAPDTALPAWDFLAELLYYMKAAGFAHQPHSDLSLIKAHWTEQLAKLSKLVEEKILPPGFSQQIATVQQTINGFKLAVLLVGHFNVGKSTLLNKWLGRELQKVDKFACTGVATQFHYAEQDHEKLVVHWIVPGISAANGGQTEPAIAREEYPLSQYPDMLSGKLAAGREAKFIELHCNLPALARHPDLILVDTPGLNSNDSRHEKALENYIGEGVACILCINRISQVGQAEQAFVARQRSFGQTFSVLVCQEDLNNLSERADTRNSAKLQAGLNDDELVRGCSSRDGNLAGFEDILAHIEKQKATLFQKKMTPKMLVLINSAKALLKTQLAAANDSEETLRDKQAAITKTMAKLDESFVQVKTELVRDCNGPVARQIQAAVANFLRGRRSDYAGQLLAGQDIGALLSADAQNAFQMAAGQTLTPRLEDAAQALGKAVPNSVISAISLSAGSLVGLGGAGNTVGGAAAGGAAGMALGSVIPVLGTVVGGVIGLVLGFFASRSNQQSEAESKALQGIESVIALMQSLIGPAIQKHAEQFLTAVRQSIDQQLETEKQNIQGIQKQLEAGAEKKKAPEQKAQAALAEVEKLLAQATPTLTQES